MSWVNWLRSCVKNKIMRCLGRSTWHSQVLMLLYNIILYSRYNMDWYCMESLWLILLLCIGPMRGLTRWWQGSWLLVKYPRVKTLHLFKPWGFVKMYLYRICIYIYTHILWFSNLTTGSFSRLIKPMLSRHLGSRRASGGWVADVPLPSHSCVVTGSLS